MRPKKLVTIKKKDSDDIKNLKKEIIADMEEVAADELSKLSFKPSKKEAAYLKSRLNLHTDNYYVNRLEIAYNHLQRVLKTNDELHDFIEELLSNEE